MPDRPAARPVDLTSKVTLITGATGGVGAAVATAFHAAGGRLALVSRSHDRLEDLAAHVGLDDTRCILRDADLRDPAQAERVVAETVSCFGRLDIVVNLIGSWEPGRLATTTDERWNDVLATNLHAVFHVMRAAAPHLSEGGVILNIGGELPIEGKGGQLAYAVAKSGVLTLTKSAALELKERGIRVNALLPKNVDTPLNRTLRPDGDVSQWVQPSQVADVLLFLASPAAAAITGALIPLDGRE
jgi:NAD(P)-dependent dehydrogenase (short-subunit alcohol dehydrogenase family)